MHQDSALTPDRLTDAWSTTLRNKGRRVTKQRLAVLRAVQQSPHSTADIIVNIVRQEIPTMRVQSVYVVLADLAEIGMLSRFEPPGTPALYETRIGDNHHHAFCIRCGKVEDVDCAIGQAPCLTPSNRHGMVLLSADVLYQGICKDCQTKAEHNLAIQQEAEAESILGSASYS